MFDFNQPVERRNSYSVQWDGIADDYGEAGLLPFTISDMDFKTAPCIEEHLKHHLTTQVLGYSLWHHPSYYATIQHWFKQRFDCNIDSKMLVYGPSVLYQLGALLQLWSEPGDEVLLHTPAYNGFYKVLDGNNRTILPCPLLQKQGRFEIDWHSFETLAARDSCKILLLCSPHNPTGRVWSKGELERMAAICQHHGVRVISDEIHMDMSFRPHTPWVEVAQPGDSWALLSSATKSFNIPALGAATP
ncbi:aminotransferase class I/II-fold pyridoxal phosphate-dependent enzyme [Dongshaea marina]|uniref:aminotransferase class I/II-fold pyridoxal phosphate-dependent enzyme n=1 Tax=Dongshaea marina TaxID=2047966 RepID=UPI002D79F3A7|nr:aminotransferase class I/II-fold pyridoxal phosphate-dependent enzyme [Dongshaea marina]